jgi:hypothetical protein
MNLFTVISKPIETGYSTGKPLDISCLEMTSSVIPASMSNLAKLAAEDCLSHQNNKKHNNLTDL